MPTCGCNEGIMVTVPASSTLVTITVTDTISLRVPLSVATTIISYTLFPPSSAGVSKSGGALKVSTPSSMEKCSCIGSRPLTR